MYCIDLRRRYDGEIYIRADPSDGILLEAVEAGPQGLASAEFVSVTAV